MSETESMLRCALVENRKGGDVLHAAIFADGVAWINRPHNKQPELFRVINHEGAEAAKWAEKLSQAEQHYFRLAKKTPGFCDRVLLFYLRDANGCLKSVFMYGEPLLNQEHQEQQLEDGGFLPRELQQLYFHLMNCVEHGQRDTFGENTFVRTPQWLHVDALAERWPFPIQEDDRDPAIPKQFSRDRHTGKVLHTGKHVY